MPGLGVGIGLRSVHYARILDERPAIPWFEVISENYMGLRGGAGFRASGASSFPGVSEGGGAGGRPFEVLSEIRRNYPVAMHGVSLNIGSTDPLDLEYLSRLKNLAARLEPIFISDHLCWTGAGGENLHDLLPLPYTQEALAHLTPRIQRVQEFLGRPILRENVSSYLAYRHSEMAEWEFIAELARRAGCGILLDVNNIYVSARNHGFDPEAYLNGVPAESVRQMHLAGYSEEADCLIDTHDHPVSAPVWALYEKAVRRFVDVPALIEWDDKIPELDVLLAEAARAEKVRQSVLGATKSA